MRLSIDGREPETYELVGDELAIGRVEVCNGTSYKTVCRNVWGNEEASVVCSQLGFSRFGKSTYTACLHLLRASEAFPNSNFNVNIQLYMYTGAVPLPAESLLLTSSTDTLSDSLNCTGDEGSVTSCFRPLTGVCNVFSNAAVRCLGQGTSMSVDFSFIYIIHDIL